MIRSKNKLILVMVVVLMTIKANGKSQINASQSSLSIIKTRTEMKLLKTYNNYATVKDK